MGYNISLMNKELQKEVFAKIDKNSEFAGLFAMVFVPCRRVTLGSTGRFSHDLTFVESPMAICLNRILSIV
jgi:hypothetical protein